MLPTIPQGLQGSLGKASNRATYRQDFRIADLETGELLDLTGLDFTFEVSDLETNQLMLQATTGNGKITVPDLGVLSIRFEADDMRALTPKQYVVGMIVEGAGETDQLFKGTIEVYWGGVQ